MTRIVLFELPEEPSLRARWLEEKVCSADCGLLIGELEAFRSLDPALTGLKESKIFSTLDDLLGPLKDEVLKNGLSVLPPGTIEAFFMNPELIAELMIEVEFAGGEYWRSVAACGSEAHPEPATPRRAPGKDTPGNRASTWLVVLAALAATILIAIVMRTPTGEKGVAWERPGVFDVQLGRDEYLEHLAKTAQEWIDDAPRNSTHLREKIEGFRRGCDLLLASSHSQLPISDREWLLERCNKWKRNFDAPLQSLQQGGDWRTISVEVNRIVSNLQSALRKQKSPNEPEPKILRLFFRSAPSSRTS